jgi:biopolymer transport protein ExbD
MSKKPKRGSPAIDMTAMVDVAFLLLTFFILTTTKFREDQAVEVDTPSSVSKTEAPAKGLMTISVDKEGKVYAGFSDIGTRMDALRRAVAENQLQVSEEGINYFSSLQEFGIPMKDIPAWLNAEGEVRENFTHTGVPFTVTDSTTMKGNEIKDWIRWGRLTDNNMRFAIKGDLDAKYETVAHVIEALRDWNINRFSLVTKMEEAPDGLGFSKAKKD